MKTLSSIEDNQIDTQRNVVDMEDKTLRIMTYLSPGIPLELFQVYQHYLEEALNMKSYLMVESRGSGPMKDRPDPFTLDDADLGFLCSTAYRKLVEEKNSYIELLPVAPVHKHERNDLQPYYYADIIILKKKSESIKEFADLAGCRWAYNDDASLSGNLCVLAELKRLGWNASFFGNIVCSGSHRNSIRMVLDARADAAAIDSNALYQYLEEHHELKSELKVLHSIGPLPIPPLVVNSRLPSELKEKIASALIEMNHKEIWKEKLEEHNVWGFKRVDASLYDMDQHIIKSVKKLSLHPTYY